MDILLSLRWIWLVVAVSSSLACHAVDQEVGGCTTISWEEVAVTPSDVFNNMENRFGVQRADVEMGRLCKRGDVSMVAIHGKGGSIPRHQSWLAVIDGKVVTIDPSQ